MICEMPDPCVRCASTVALTTRPRNELYFYTARLCLNETGGMLTDVSPQPRGRLCEACTQAFVDWLKARSRDQAGD